MKNTRFAMKNNGMMGMFFRWFNFAGTRPVASKNGPKAARERGVGARGVELAEESVMPAVRLATALEHRGQTATKRTPANRSAVGEARKAATLTATGGTASAHPRHAHRTFVRAFLFAFLLFISTWFTGSYVYSQNTARQINGKVSFRIEKVTLSPAEAATKIDNKEKIPLRVYIRFEGKGWTDYIESQYKDDFGQMVYNHISFNASSFMFGIAQDGTEKGAFLKTNIPAYIMSGVAGCTAPDGGSMSAAVSNPAASVNVVKPLWESFACPEYAYGLGFSATDIFKDDGKLTKGTNEKGETYYEEPMFYVWFRLKEAKTVYVRGVDVQGNGGEQNPTANNHVTDNPYDDVFNGATATSTGQTSINIINPNIVPPQPFGWPGNEDGTDWTEAPNTYYGGIIPGGIFIENDAEVTPLLPFLV